MIAEFDDSKSKNWVEGASLSIQELHINYGLPREEIASFQNMICIYPYRGVIVKEGELSKEMYLLRSGRVGIFKKMGSKLEKLAEIEAVNFFGEMSLINSEPRNATVIAMSKEVVLYKISQPNLHIIINNPKWAELLLTRLSKNLAHNNEQLAAATSQVGALHAEVTEYKNRFENQRESYQMGSTRTLLALNGILFFQEVVMNLAVVESKGWAYLNALSRISRALITHYIPDADVSPKSAEIGVIRECLAFIRKGEKDKIFDDLNLSI